MPVSEKKLRSNPAWIKRHLTDPFVKKSVQEGYRARSVYKLMEIDDKDKIIKPGMSVVDLGAAPGSWTQIVKERLTDKDGKIDGKVIAMDILPMEPIEGVHFLQGDFREQEVADKLTDLLEGEKVDVVLYSQYVEACKKTFRKVSVRKPEASRSSSAEVYIVARDLK